MYRICELRDDGAYHCIEDGLFYADDLPEKDRRVLEDYVNSNVPGVTHFPPRYPLYSCSKFIQRVFYRYAHKGALIVGFNLNCDLARIAKKWTEGAKNEWSLILSTYADGAENLHNPALHENL